MQTADFDFHLPSELIAQEPASRRDASRLLVVHRRDARLEHRQFTDLLEYLQPGDVLVLNDSRVFCARLRARNPKTGGAFEILLLEEGAGNDWWAMMRPAKRARVGAELAILDRHGQPAGILANVIETNDEGHRRLQFQSAPGVWPFTAEAFNIADALDSLGEMPLPPYIRRGTHNPERESQDQLRYQTVFARDKGSVAAPTAGLHFTSELLANIRESGVEVVYITLHVGLGTFAPVKADRVENHSMHSERFLVPHETAQAINRAKAEKRRVLAVGTTSVRVLESVAREHDGKIVSRSGRTNIFIYPPFPFRIVDGLLTNFHLPRSTLLMLVSAFATPGESRGRELILRAYEEAVKERYRFFSYGDAMLLLP